jgi:hypothetical protein
MLGMVSGEGSRSMTFQARPSDVFAALLEAAQRTGFQYLSGDVSTGTAMFTSGRFLLGVGEKVSAQWEEVAPGAIQVTMSSSKFGIAGSGRRRPGVDRMSDELSGLLPHVR